MILWFRNDLRLHDNPAFVSALEHGCNKAVFLATPKQWAEHQLAPIKVDLMLRHVTYLKSALLAYGIDLLVEEVADFNDQITWFVDYAKQQSHQPSQKTLNFQVFANSEVELNEQKRDAALLDKGLNLTLFEADVIIPKGKVLNKSGEMFKVFTPFKNAWLNYVKLHGFDYIPKNHLQTYLKSSETITDNIDYSTFTDYSLTDSAPWPLAEQVEQVVFPQFLSEKICDYQQHRDIPSIKGTSGLSAYLNIGAISPRYLLILLLHRYPDILSKSPEAEFAWLNELIWREFYRHLLFHFPKLCQGENFNDKYNHLPWPSSLAHLTAWQQGKTGYPIVDAAMRQLNQTGWMHNRLRMIVASFLTKHLLVDWRLGEAYFMSKLIDGDLAANNGGWQWSAGTGCDAQPYFRVFNPITQSQRFDPNGDFIRKYLPELRDIPNKEIHFPHQYMQKHQLTGYWPEIVEHKTARLQALDFYKSYS